MAFLMENALPEKSRNVETESCPGDQPVGLEGKKGNGEGTRCLHNFEFLLTYPTIDLKLHHYRT